MPILQPPRAAGLLLILLSLVVRPTARSQVAPVLTARDLPPGRVLLAWPADAGNYALEQATSLGPGARWLAVESVPARVGAEFRATVEVASGQRYFRLARPTSVLTTLAESSPRADETGVAVTRETIVRFSAPLASDTVIGPETLYAAFGTRRILSRAVLSSDRTRVTLFHLEPLPGSARIHVYVDGSGLRDAGGVPVDVDGDGQAGGSTVIAFETSNQSPLASTGVIGRVFASEPVVGADGTFGNRPLAGVTITVDGMEETLRTVTDGDGRFLLHPVPPGRFFVHIDGRTVTNLAAGIRYPDRAYYPFVGKAWEAVAAVATNLAGGTGEIYLPLIAAEALTPVSAVRDTAVALPAAATAQNPLLAEASLVVPADSLFDDAGVRGGRVGLAIVDPDRLPGPLPPGLQLPVVITVQTDGPLNLDRPAPICFPNVPDPVLGAPLPAGSRQTLFSFNHDRGEWEPVGPMTVSADGRRVCTDPGVGVVQPGWHGVGAPPTSPPPPPNRCRGGGEPGPAASAACAASCDSLRELCFQQREREDSLAFHRCVYYLRIGSQALFETCTGFAPDRETALQHRLRCTDEAARCEYRCLDCSPPSSGASLASVPPHHAAESRGADVPLNPSALPATAEADQLLSQATALLTPFANAYQPIPDSTLVRVNDLWEQAADLVGDPATYLESRIIEEERRLAAAAAALGREPDELRPGNAPPYPVLYAAKVLRPGGPMMLRGQTEAHGRYSLFLPRDGTLLGVGFFDPRTGAYGSINPNLDPGAPFPLRRFTLRPLGEDAPDFDRDGLPDVVEEVRGTSPTDADSDDDGIRDGAEVEQGTDPLGGRSVRTGIIASARTPGAALDIATADGIALTAEGAAGVSVIDIREPLRPTLVTHLDTRGTAQRVASAGTRAVVADGNAGLAIIEFGNAAEARLSHQLPLAGVLAVAAGGDRACAGMASGQVVEIDLMTGAVKRSLGVSAAAVVDLALDGAFLYVLTADRLHVVSLAGDVLAPVASVNVPSPLGPQRRLSVGAGIAYTVHRKGYNTLDVANPAMPVLLDAGNTAQFGWKQIVPNGSGLGIAAVGANSTDDGDHDVALYDLSDPRTNNVRVTVFPTPGIARAVSIHQGLAYVADDRSGLQVINYLPFDALGVPPTVRLMPGFSPTGVEEGRPVGVLAAVTDDVQVRVVELFVDGVRAITDGAFPFEFRFVTPARRPGKESVVLQARAVDTGGNSAWSEELSVPLVEDATAPVVVDHYPVGGGRTVSSVVAYFSEPVAAGTLTSSALRLFSAGPDGAPGTADDTAVSGGTARLRSGAASASLEFPAPLSAGAYRAVVTTSVTDVAGNPLVREYAWTFLVADAAFWSRRSAGDWDDPFAWNGGVVPGADEDVVIDVPGDVTITVPRGTHRVRSLMLRNPLALEGRFEVAGEMRVGSRVDFRGGTLAGAILTLEEDGRLVFGNDARNTLDAVTVHGDLDLTTGFARVVVRNGLRLHGRVELAASGTLMFAGEQSFDSGTVVFAAGSGMLGLESGSTLNLGPDVLIRGNTGIVGQAILSGRPSRLVNRGRILSDVDAGTISVRVSQFENLGQLGTANGGSLVVDCTAWTNSGAIDAAGGTLTLDGAFANTGTIQSRDAIVSLDSAFSPAGLGTLRRTGGTIRVRKQLDLRGAILDLNDATGPWRLEGATILGGTVNQSGAGRLEFNSSTLNFLDGVTVNGDLDLREGAARVRVRNGLVLNGRVLIDRFGAIGFSGDQTLGSGSIHFEGVSGALSVDGDTTLTLGPEVVVRGRTGFIGQSVFAPGNTRIINRGLVTADVADGILTIVGAGFENFGRLETANRGSLTVASTEWVNSGVIAADQGILTLDHRFTNTGSILAREAVVRLDGDFTLDRLGVFRRSGGEIRLRGDLDLTGDTLSLDASTGSWSLDGGTVRGGTIVQREGAGFIFRSNSGNTFDGVTVEGDLDLSSGTSRLLVRSGITLRDRVVLDRDGAIGFVGVQTLGAGTFEFRGNNGFLSVEGGSTLTLGPEVVIRGKSGVVGQAVFQGGTNLLVNRGRILSDVTNGNLVVRPTRFENPGRVETAGGGGITLAAQTWSSTGTILANDGTVTLDRAFTNAGSLAGTNGTLVIESDFVLSQLGSFRLTGGSVRQRGRLDLGTGTLEVNAGTGPWILEGGVIAGGTVRQDGAKLVLRTGNTLDGVAVIGDLDLTTGNARVLVRNGLTVSGQILIRDQGAVGFAGDQAFDGRIVFTGTSGFVSIDGNTTLTLGPECVVRGQTGRIGAPAVFIGGTSRLVNRGLISADVAGGTITISPNSFENLGRLEEKNGGRLVRP